MKVPIQIELVALGVAAEIIVVIENENAAIGRSLGAVEVRGGESADPGTHDDEIVLLTGIGRLRQRLPVAQRMGRLEGAGMTAAKPGESRG